MRHTEIWLGVGGSSAVDLVGRKADGWLPSLGPVPGRRLTDLHTRLDDAAVRAGRDPRAIRRLLNLSGMIGEGHGLITGSPESWVAWLVALAVDNRIDIFLFWPSADQLRQIQLFAEEVIPAVRERPRQDRGNRTRVPPRPATTVDGPSSSGP
jgi:alkanesulfonate monooxygenase SsuD/methylene tetrahydromethanopterin reductase-like flavin-dependent oxidoreductase (luciferase family)